MTRAKRTGRRQALGSPFRVAANFIDTLLPSGCAVCSAAVPVDRPPVCGLCASRVQPVPPPRCLHCGLTRILDIEDADRCPECAGWPEHLRTASACLHSGVPAQLVHGLKYRGYTALAPFLASRMLAPALFLSRGVEPVLVPVPLAASRRRERGFNQAQLLASALGSVAGWRTVGLLSRPEGGPALVRRGRHERETIAGSAYAVTSDALAEARIPGSPTLVVDDVITTGATLEACTRVLMEAGLECVGGVSFTRTAARLDEA